MTARIPLPQRRQAYTCKFQFGRIKYYGTWSVFGDQFHPDHARLAEIFVQAGKAGSDVEAAMRDAAVAASLALQFGCPSDVLRAAMTRLDDKSAAGPLGMFLDVIAREAGKFAEAAE